MKQRTSYIIWNNTGVYMAAVFDYLMEEILDLAGFCTKQLRRKIIQPAHVQAAIQNDTELNELFPNVPMET